MHAGNFILLDSARMGEAMEEAKELNRNVEPLFNSKADTLLQAVGPFVFTFSDVQSFDDYFFQKGWGDHWGVILSSSADLKDVSEHFRRFLKVKTEDGLELYFRFYDPRVLRIFLPTCDANQLNEFFGPVHYFLMEDEDKHFAVKFWLERTILKTKRIPFEDLAGEDTKPELAQPVEAPKPAVRESQPQKPARRFSVFDDDDVSESAPEPKISRQIDPPEAPMAAPAITQIPSPPPQPPPEPAAPKKPRWDIFD
jgi:hypothetical protein